MPAIDTHRVEAFAIGLFKTDFTKAMFTESAGLHDEASGFVSVAIHQLHAHATIAQLVNEGGRVRWQPRSLTIGVVVTNRGTKQSAVVDRLGSAGGDLGEGLGQHHVHRNLVALNDVEMRSVVIDHLPITLQRSGVFGSQDLLRPAGVAPLVILETWQFGLSPILLPHADVHIVPVAFGVTPTNRIDQFAVFVGHGRVIKVDHLLRAHRTGFLGIAAHVDAVQNAGPRGLERQVPPIGAIPCRYDKLPIGSLESVVDEQSHLRTQKLEPA